MQTALQDFIERLNYARDFNTMIPGIIKVAESLLEKEKEQIIDAYNNGQQIPPFEYAEQYYNQTYNQNK
jgi:hypothetical protein